MNVIMTIVSFWLKTEKIDLLGNGVHYSGTRSVFCVSLPNSLLSLIFIWVGVYQISDKTEYTISVSDFCFEMVVYSL